MSTAVEKDKALEHEAEMFAMAAVTNLPANTYRLYVYKTAQSEDSVSSQVTQHCLQGWPSKHQMIPQMKPYWTVKKH